MFSTIYTIAVYDDSLCIFAFTPRSRVGLHAATAYGGEAAVILRREHGKAELFRTSDGIAGRNHGEDEIYYVSFLTLLAWIQKYIR